ncbi:uncharacterized protein LOC110037559 [Phalaenopsis equestris]|uniref:uncharacterized protein LOC110037559 n=1 Tax=Phalaenopsis equestris TaxID=78828 RepID=UPI0009E2BB17|nr:uncharacterized protein LOC110037559 [Phalaenopsis equestris]
MQANTQTRVLFLEDWLGSAAKKRDTFPPPVTAVSARSILQAWSDLRDTSLLSSDSNRLVAALQTLDAARSSLQIADPQAKLLLSLLSFDPPLPPNSLSFILRLLYCWLRKTPRASPSLVNSAAAKISHIFSFRPQCPEMSVLFLGALIVNPALEVSNRRDCLDILYRILESVQLEEEAVADFLAGIGYALSRSDEPYFSKIFSFLLKIWKRGSPPASVYCGLMLLSLLEWLVTNFIYLRTLGKVEVVCGELSAANWEAKGYAPLAVSMASAGCLRAFRLVPGTNRIRLSPDMKRSVEGSISSIAKLVVSNLDGSLESSHLLQCISIGLARAGPVSFSAPILLAICKALLKEIFPLGSFCSMAVEIQEGTSVDFVLEKVKGHLDSAAFKEAGVITSIFCNQYASADEEHKGIVENYMWKYALEFYSNLRYVVLVHRGRHDQLLGYLEKVAEAAFLMIVVYAAEVASQKLNPKSSNGIQSEASVRILIAFSCIEYMRRVRLPEYTDAVRRAVLTMQENSLLCASFVESIPSYSELTDKQGLFALEGTRYVWSEDEVQTARMLFYLRVIPTCISFIPASLFGELIAPTMFLYLQHPNEKVARASHSVFAAFMSSGKDTDKDERVDLKEKLVFYYIQRSLEVYPGITPFEGLASGVAALVRQLPAGSPAIFYCINCLTEKARDLCNKATSKDADMWKTWDGSAETCKKVLDLLMRLIYLVDIQVLPYLLKQLAEFILQLPEDGQNATLDELYVQVAESDDVTRKPVLVSWLQSLSYLCSQKVSSRTKPNNLISPSNTAASLNGTSRQILPSML